MPVKPAKGAASEKITRRKDSLDDDSLGMIYQGVTISQLEQLFHVDHRRIKERIFGNVAPVGKRGAAPIYRVDEVAPYIVKPAYDIEAYIMKMHHNELPKMLTKEFWAGKRAKQEYDIKAGDLWPTEQVIECVSELMKLVKMQVQLLADTVERQTGLNDRQRAIIEQACDGMLTDLRNQVTAAFGEDEEDEADEDDSL